MTPGPELPTVDRVVAWLGITLTYDQRRTLARYGAWLQDEAAAAGGIGPEERHRIESRHLADALSYLAGIRTDPDSLADLGSGVGLPGIPLAIVMPRVSVTLVDRSGRRAQLLRRATRVLGLVNVEVVEADFRSRALGSFDVVTLRGVVPFSEVGELVRPHLTPGGEAVMGVSRRGRPDEAAISRYLDAAGLAGELVEVPSDVLDSPAWLLRMTIRDQ